MAFPETMNALQVYIRQAEALAALGARLGAEAGTIAPNRNLLSKLDAVRCQYHPELMADLSKQDMETLYGFIRASLRQMLHLLELPGDSAEGWSFDDPQILQAQGRASRLVTKLLTEHAQADAEFGQLLSNGANFLDIGSGVGWISLSMAQQWPNLHSTGIDILAPALDLAARNLEDTGLSGRVCFRNQDVADLADVEQFDVVFIPVIFIPQEIVETAMSNLRRALKPGGWLFAAAYRIPDDPRLAALNDLKTTLSGGRVWTAPELGRTIEHSGLHPVGDIASNSPLHLLAARRTA